MRRLFAMVKRHRLVTGLAALVLTGGLVAGFLIASHGGRPPARTDSLEAFFKTYQSYLLKLPEVVSVGIGERHGKRFIQVYVRELSPRAQIGIPKKLGGWDVRVKVLDDPEPSPQSPRPSPRPSVLPDPDAVAVDIRGVVTGLTRLAEPEGDVLGWILVEGHTEPGVVCDSASVAVTATTRFYQVTDKGLQPLEVALTDDQLRGRAVEIDFDGDLSGADPVQATAGVIVLVSAEQ